MYTLNVTNNYSYNVPASNAKTVAKDGGKTTFEKQGSLLLEIPGIGTLNFIDLGDKKLEGHPDITETWGVLIRAITTEAYYRYEGNGVLNLEIDKLGTSTLNTDNGSLVQIKLRELSIETKMNLAI
ncbi:hypothetical protein D1815_19025 [Aquimarina sp. AD1]|uniref:hypothetical protein n=1 Tax=Aquimarina TaxID=290174 RepID=UPI00041BF795|nr:MULTISPECIES: hypothetical protein [Aquimarina]AXT57743.1 hypothetical protein D1815_19025 [Aquimarina sp. AD1]RKN29831.1 hypothetical protein D7035_06715 [Aquimarina sp. AD1]